MEDPREDDENELEGNDGDEENKLLDYDNNEPDLAEIKDYVNNKDTLNWKSEFCHTRQKYFIVKGYLFTSACLHCCD